VDNSIRYGGKVTEIRVSFEDSNGTGKILFEDNGTGIPAAQKTRIFSKDAGKTPGFGLFISKEILGYHDISIKETGEPGKGARFEIEVPMARVRIGKNIVGEMGSTVEQIITNPGISAHTDTFNTM
jgi:signal transduction histidine kinase